VLAVVANIRTRNAALFCPECDTPRKPGELRVVDIDKEPED
jgi:hypothetical protein